MGTKKKKTVNRNSSYLSMSVSLEESRKPLAKGLLSIFSLVIWKRKNEYKTNHFQCQGSQTGDLDFALVYRDAAQCYSEAGQGQEHRRDGSQSSAEGGRCLRWSMERHN